MGIFSGIARFLSSLFGRRKEEGVKEKKSAHERVQDSFFIKVHGNLLRFKKRLGSIGNEEGAKEARRKLEEMRGEFFHLNRRQRVYLSGIFKQCETGIINLERKFKDLKRKEQLARKAA